MEETLILNFEVDQSSAESKLEKLEGLLIDNRKAQKELTKAFKEGAITQEEYIRENLRLQQNIKKEQEQKKTIIKLLDAENNSINALTERNKELRKERNNLDLTSDSGIKKLERLNKEIDKNDKAIQKNVSLLEKQRLNIGNYASALDVVVPGTAAFFNQSTALAGALGTTAKAVQATGFSLQTLNAIPIVAVVTGIVAAYTLLNSVLDDTASKTKEVKYRQEAYNRELKNTEGILRAIDAAIKEEEDTRSKAFEASVDAANVLADRIGRLADITNESAKDEINNYQNRLLLLTQSISLYDQESATRIKAIEDYKASVLLLDESGNVIDSLLTKEETLALDDRLNAIKDSYSNTVKALKKEVEELNFVIEQTKRDANAPLVDISQNNSIIQNDVTNPILDPIIRASMNRQDQYVKELETVELTEKQKREFYKESADIQRQIDRQAFQAALDFASGLAGLFQEQTAEYKVFASAETILSTYSAATKAYEAAFTPPTAASPALGAAYAGLAIANGLANLAKINGVEFAEGGWTGPGDKYDVAGVVHADEYVVPKSVNNSPAAQPHLAALERMRGGYADGGFVANRNTAPAQQALIMANALKNLPAPVVSVAEVTRVQNRIHARERVSTLRP
jgi:hypothetical protein